MMEKINSISAIHEAQQSGKVKNSFSRGRIARGFSEKDAYNESYAITRYSSEHSAKMSFDINLNLKDPENKKRYIIY